MPPPRHLLVLLVATVLVLAPALAAFFGAAAAAAAPTPGAVSAPLDNVPEDMMEAARAQMAELRARRAEMELSASAAAKLAAAAAACTLTERPACGRECEGRAEAAKVTPCELEWRRLHWAAQRGDAERVRELLAEAGAAGAARMLEADDDRSARALHLAAGNGHAEAVRALLAAGAAPMARAWGRRTALHYAAANGHGDVVALLLDGGAAVDARGNMSDTPLHHAAERGQLGAMAALLARNAKVDARASRGETPLLLAARRGHAAAASELAARGANVSAVDADGHDALLLAAVAKEEGNGAATIRALAQISSEVLAAVRTPYGKARGGATVLHVACQMAHGDAVTKALIELGAAINARDEKGFTPLMIAALRGALEPAAALLLADADAALTRTSSAGAVETALDYARLRMRQDEQSPDDPNAKGYVSRAMREEHRALVSVLEGKAAAAARKASASE